MIAQSPAKEALAQCRQIIMDGKERSHPWDDLSASTREALLRAITDDGSGWSMNWADMRPNVQTRILRLVKAISVVDWKGHI